MCPSSRFADKLEPMPVSLPTFQLPVRPLLTVLFVVAMAASARAGELLEHPDTSISPPLKLADLGDNTYSLSDFRGQVVLVNFWASWCPPCIIEMPSLQRLRKKLEDRPFSILAVNVREKPAAIWKFRRLVKVDFPLLLDREGQAAEDWGITVYPSSFLVGPDGRVRYAAYGPLQWDAPEIIETIEALLPTKEPRTESAGLRSTDEIKLIRHGKGS